MQIRFVANSSHFSKVPGDIFCYWLSETVLNHLEKDERLNDYGSAKQGLSTSDNNRFLRYWHEVVFNRIGFQCKDCNDTNSEAKKWFPYNKAGNFRKWSSINEYVVNYQNNGEEIKRMVMQKYPYLNGPGFVVKNTDSYFHHGITWNDVATGKFCCRFVPDGFIFADAGPMYFSENDYIMMAFFNSNTFQVFADIICQGLHYSTGHIPQIPYKVPDEDKRECIAQLSEENYAISKEEWDSFESSWNFYKHPLL